jgi:protocatechuate 3,4-dioxygenase beta subunit
MAKRTIVVLGLIVAAVVALWWWRGRGASAPPRPVAGSSTAPSSPSLQVAAARAPHGQARAAIAGTVRDPAGAPIAGARVCAAPYGEDVVDHDTRTPTCIATDGAGAYRLEQLLAVPHAVSASAPRFRPARWRHPTDDDDDLRLTAGQTRTGVDLVLTPGGVEVTGVVEDVSGGPIAGAVVSVSLGRWLGGDHVGAVTDATGSFTLWTQPGEVSLRASADGYAPGAVDAAAPSRQVAIYLTPESSLTGVVVTAGDRRPVAGAVVEAGGDWTDGAGGGRTRTDEAGRFRLDRLAPGRWKPVAQGDGWYGEAADSVLLGLGQSVDGLVIEVAPVARVSGRVVIGAADGPPCASGYLSLRVPGTERSVFGTAAADGAVSVSAVRPGRYQVQVSCAGHVEADRYDPVEVAAADVTGLTWIVQPGVRLRGTVRASGGEPLGGVQLFARTTGGASRARSIWAMAQSRPDGSYVIDELLPGSYELSVDADDQRALSPAPVVEVGPGDTVYDVTLPAGGEVAGVVVDAEGAPVRGARVETSGSGRWSRADTRTGDDGGFVLRGVEPGERRVTASRGWADELRAPGTTDDDKQGVVVKVVAGQRANVRLVVETERGTIAGVVKDAAGTPVADAWISATRESDAAGAAAGGALRWSRWAWGNDARPVVTGVDGGFRLDRLGAGTYTVRAFRRGGGEAVAEKVALGTTALALTIAATGSLGGTVVRDDGAPFDEFTIALRDERTGFRREESFYRTSGRFALRDLPAGTFIVSAAAEGAQVQTTVTLAAGEDKAELRLTLAANLAVRGRFVHVDTGAPVQGLRARITPVQGGGRMSFGDRDGERADVSDETGSFRVAGAGRGLSYLLGIPEDPRATYSATRWVVDVAGAGEVDVGDIPVVPRRVEPGDPRSDVGMSFVEREPGSDPRQYQLKVSRVEPGGPAAAAGIVAGDVIVAIDGYDVRGARSSLAWPLLRVKVGVAVELALARGVTVRVVARADT